MLTLTGFLKIIGEFFMQNLKKNEEFQKIYKIGKKAFGYYALVYIMKNNLEQNRCGYVVSKKTGNAVCRNRLKRLFREYYRGKDSLTKQGYDIVFIAKRNAGNEFKTLKLEKLSRDLDKIFRRLGLL